MASQMSDKQIVNHRSCLYFTHCNFTANREAASTDIGVTFRWNIEDFCVKLNNFMTSRHTDGNTNYVRNGI